MTFSSPILTLHTCLPRTLFLLTVSRETLSITTQTYIPQHIPLHIPPLILPTLPTLPIHPHIPLHIPPPAVAAVIAILFPHMDRLLQVHLLIAMSLALLLLLLTTTLLRLPSPGTLGHMTLTPIHSLPSPSQSTILP